MKLSIITINRNNADGLKQTLVSVAEQICKDFEHIVIDGASTDNSVYIIKDFSHIAYYVSEPDNGIYDAMNKGIAMTTGDIVGIVNSDDFYVDEKIIEKTMYCFQEKNVDAVYGDLLYVNAEKTDKIQRYWKPGHYKKNAFLWGWMPPHPTFFVKNEVYKKYGNYNTNFRSAADYEFMLRVIHKEQIKLIYLPEILVKMRTGGKSNKNIINRVRGNNEDREAWRVNGLLPYFFTQYLKPARKIFQYIQRPKSQ